MNIPEMTVANIVSQNPGSAIVFKKHNIDFCCNGKILLKEACDKAGVPTEQILKEISELHREPGTLLRFNQWSIGLLINFIIENHHHYLTKSLPQILQLAHKVASVHGENHPELVELYYQVNALAKDLQEHTKKEELNVFPQLKQLETDEGLVISESAYKDLLSELEGEHETAGEALSNMKSLTGGYMPPADACNSYRILFKLLEELEDDTHQHIHLENNILFPIAMEYLNFKRD